ncbi:MAG: hypothetical protein GX078_01885 [Clostridiales bacterium]|nr:hypothetical protein [Clostridiales bacterium]
MKFSVTVANLAKRTYEIEAETKELAETKALEFYDYNTLQYEFGVVEIHEIV